MEDLKTKWLFSVRADLEMPQNIGMTPHGVRKIVYVKGGQFEGSRLRGRVLPGGGDWLLIRPDGAWEIDVRATLYSDDEQLIYTYYRGILNAAPEIVEQFLKGNRDVDPSLYYFRTTPVFETGSDKYGWLNRIITVGVGRLSNTGLAYEVYEIL